MRRVAILPRHMTARNMGIDRGVCPPARRRSERTTVKDAARFTTNLHDRSAHAHLASDGLLARDEVARQGVPRIGITAVLDRRACASLVMTCIPRTARIRR